MSFDETYDTEPDETIASPIDDSDAATPESGSARTKRSKRGSRSISARQVETVLDTFESVSEFDSSELSVMAGLLGVDADVRAVTIATLTGRSDSAALASQIVEWSKTTDVEVTLSVMQLSEQRAGLSSVWSVLTSLGAASGTMPRSAFEATRKIVQAVRDLSTSQVSILERVAALSK